MRVPGDGVRGLTTDPAVSINFVVTTSDVISSCLVATAVRSGIFCTVMVVLDAATLGVFVLTSAGKDPSAEVASMLLDESP